CKMSAARKNGAELPRDPGSAGPEIAGSRENHRAVVFPRQQPVAPERIYPRRRTVLPDASDKIPAAPAGNCESCKPTRRGPPPDARGISRSTCRGFRLQAWRRFPSQAQVTLMARRNSTFWLLVRE